MSPARAGIVVAALLSTACAGSGAFVCPARGGPPWHEATSDHFVVRTDAGEKRAIAITRELEGLRSALLPALDVPDVATPGQVEVVVFRNRDDLLSYTRDVRIGGLMVEDGMGERRILVADDGGDQARRLVAHELVHVLAYHAIHRQPHWFAEGLAGFMEGAGESRLGGGRVVGSPPGDDEAFLPVAVTPPVRDVLEWNQGLWPLEHLYAKSFLIVHYLYNERREGLRAFEKRLAAMENPRSAWNRTFPEWSLDAPDAPAKLDAAIAAYAKRYVRRVPLETPSVRVDPAIRSLTGAEVHALRLGLPHRWIAEAVREEVAEALAEDPANAPALQKSIQARPQLALAAARKATAAHPEDPHAWEFLADSLQGSPSAAEREAALRRAVGAAPSRARSHVLLAIELLRQRRADDALAESGRALELAPWSPVALLVQGESLARLGRCDDAMSAAWRATEVAAHSPAALGPVGEGFGVIQRICARGASASGSGSR